MENGILRKAPKFKTEEEAAKFWLDNDTTDYEDWSKAERPNRKHEAQLVPVFNTL